MIRRRDKPDGLPFRVYERRGIRIYSIGYKMKSGRWAFKFDCPVDDPVQILALRRRAIEESSRVREEVPVSGFKGLVRAWQDCQEELPMTDARKRATSTMEGNESEAANLVKAWGHFDVDEINRTMGYEYLDACAAAGRPEKGNKEIALARLILEFAIRKGLVTANVLDQISKNKHIAKAKRYVSHDEMEVVLAAGRVMGGPYLIIALALKTAWLCVRRSFEVRQVSRDAIKDSGIVWTD